MACPVDKHALKGDISEWLRRGDSYGVINARLLDRGYDKVAPVSLSRHLSNKKCLGLPPRQAPKEKLTEVSKEEPAEQVPTKVIELETPDLKEVADLALAIFYRRMKQAPDEISIQTLGSIVTAMFRGDKTPPDEKNFDAIVRQLGSDGDADQFGALPPGAGDPPTGAQ